MVQEESDRSYRASGALKSIEDQTKRPLHLDVGVEVEASIGAVDQTHRRADLKLAAASLIELAAPHAGPENMQLGLAHRAFEPEQQPVVEAGWVVDAILVENKSGGQRA